MCVQQVLPKPPEFPSNPFITLPGRLLSITSLQLLEIYPYGSVDTICREIFTRGVLLRF